MIKCKKCNKDKNYNKYYVTGPTMYAVCKTCLNKIIDDRNSRNSDTM